MPATSPAQKRLMEAAAHTKGGYGGVPQSVGKEFVGDANMPIAAGIVFVAPDGEVLLVRRSSKEENYPGHWALPGGKADGGESDVEAAIRECREEIGFDVDVEAHGLKLLDKIATPNGMAFSTFAKPVDDKFVPKLNGEHSGYAWAQLDMLPGPLHPSVRRVLGEHIGVSEDMTPEEWDGLRKGFAKWTREEEKEPEHAKDSVRLVFDRKSLRSYTQDGFMRVERTPISKANVCEYYGREIPHCEALGLNPDFKYKLLRAPEELSKAADSFNGVQLLLRHVPVNPDDHRPDITVGAVGTSAEFVHPYLYNSLTIHAREGIDAVESDQQKKLSSSYRYRADMTPGIFEGVRYDGVMRDISGNHVALVKEGRAGADVVVADSMPTKELKMAKSTIVLSRAAVNARGAIAAYLMPKLAQDAKIDVTPILQNITAKNFGANKSAIITGVTAAVQGKLAKDAKIDTLTDLIDALEDDDVAEGADADPDGKPMSAEEMKAKDKAKDESPEEKEKREKEAADKKAKDEAEEKEKKEKEAMDKKARDGEEPKVTKAAMDAAIEAATKTATSNAMKLANDIKDAERTVKPYVGELSIAFDSVEGVYRAALKAMDAKVDGLDTLPANALKAIITAQPLKGSRGKSTFAEDAKPAGNNADYAKRFPGAAGIQFGV